MTEKEKIVQMIVSHDAEIRNLGITLAIQYPEWVLSLQVSNIIIDFCGSCMDTGIRGDKKFAFAYEDNYYLLEETSAYISCYSLTNISKKEYEQYNNMGTEKENN